MNINLTKQNGITLETSGKLCNEDINIIPALQEKTVEASGEYTPDDGYVGISKVTVNVTTPTYEVYAGETEAVPTGFNVTYKAGEYYAPVIPTYVGNITLNFTDGTTETWSLSTTMNNTPSFPDDWTAQTGEEPGSGSTGNGYTWSNVLSVSISIYNPGGGDDSPVKLYVNDTVTAQGTITLTEDITFYHDGGGF